MKSFIPDKKTFENKKKFVPKGKTVMSMQNTLNTALQSRAPQNNGSSIEQPQQAQGFGRSV